MKHSIGFDTRRGTPLPAALASLLVAFLLLFACCPGASAEINAKIVDMPARTSEHLRITTFSGEMPEGIADALVKAGYSDYGCYTGAMIEKVVNQNYRGDASKLNTLALVAIEKDGHRTLIGLTRHENNWGFCDLGEKALLPDREFTIGASDMDNGSAWYIPLRFTITYPMEDGGSEVYGLYANLGQTGIVPTSDILHLLWYVSDYIKTDADGQGTLVMSAGGAFRVLSLPFDPAEGEGYFPAYLPCTLDHMDSVLEYPTNKDDAQRIAEASWARFEDTDLALAWGGVNLRQYPTTASKSLGEIRSGALVHVLGEENGWDAPWYHVRLGHEEGFISGVYVKFPMTDGFASDLSIAPLTVAQSLDAVVLREAPEADALGTEFPANTLMHVLADVEEDWLYVMVPNGDIGWEMDLDGTSGYVRISEVAQGVCSAKGGTEASVQAEAEPAPVADAVAEPLGVFDFLNIAETLPEDFETYVQTAFDQQGGEMQELTVTVRDAVSDGVAVYMAVAFKAKNPDAIVLLDIDATPGLVGNDRVGRKPYTDWLRDGQPLIVVGHTAAALYGAEPWVDLVAGIDWDYEQADTLVVHYVIDLRSIPNLSDPLDLILSPITIEISDDASWRTTDEAEIRVSVNAGQMEAAERAAALPADINGYHLLSARLLFTPLATYADITYQGDPYPDWDKEPWDAEAFDQWMNRDGNMWFRISDAHGEYPNLTGGLHYSDGSEDETMPVVLKRSVYVAAAEIPDNITVVAYDAVSDEAYDQVMLALLP